MSKIEIFNRTDKHLIVNSVEINGVKLVIPPHSSGRSTGPIDEEYREDFGIQELLDRKEISIKKVPAKKISPRTPSSSGKKTSKKSNRRGSSKKVPKHPDDGSGKPVIVTSQGTTKRVGTVGSAEQAFVDEPKADEKDEYSPAFIDV